MDQLNGGLGRIREASEREAGQSERVRSIAAAIQEITTSVHGSAEEQVDNTSHLAGGIETVNANTHQIEKALGAQSQACDQVVSVLERMLGRNRDTEESVGTLDRTMRELLSEAVDLRVAVEHFVLEKPVS